MSNLLLRATARALLAGAILLVVGTFIYGFGAGYFWPIGLPTPLNVVATFVLSAVVLRWAWFFTLAPFTRGQRHRGTVGR